MLLLQHRHSFRFAWDQLQKHAMLLWMIAPPGGQSTQKGFYVGSKLHLILSSVDQFSLPMRWSIFSKLGGSSIDPFLIIFFCFFLGLHRYHKFEACLFLHISGFIIQNHFGSSCLMAETFLKEFLEISKSTYQFLELFNGWIMCLSPHFFKHVFALHGSPWHHPKPFHFGSIQDFRKNELPKITTRQHLDSFRMTYCMFFWAYLSNLFIHKEKTIYVYIYIPFLQTQNHLEVSLNFRCKTTPLRLDQNLHFSFLPFNGQDLSDLSDSESESEVGAFTTWVFKPCK